MKEREGGGREICKNLKRVVPILTVYGSVLTTHRIMSPFHVHQIAPLHSQTTKEEKKKRRKKPPINLFSRSISIQIKV